MEESDIMRRDDCLTVKKEKERVELGGGLYLV